MDNTEKLARLGTDDTWQRQTKQKTQHRKLKRWATVKCWTSLHVIIHIKHNKTSLHIIIHTKHNKTRALLHGIITRNNKNLKRILTR